MGKATNRKQTRHNPLLNELSAHEGNLKVQKKSTIPNNKDEQEEYEDEDYVDARESRKILQLAKEQQDELEVEEESKTKKNELSSIARFKVEDDEEEDADAETYEEEFNEEDYEGEYEDGEELVEISEEDAAMFDDYFKTSSDFNSLTGSFNLADKIMAAIREKEAAAAENIPSENGGTFNTNSGSGPIQEGVALPPKLIKAYITVGEILTTWTHGKLPKLFKIIPTLHNWQDVLYVANPDAWSPNIVYEATKLFVSNLTAKEATKFVNIVLLPRFQMEIENTEKHNVNYHTYRALKKSLYKPSAFFKGFLFPLVDQRCNVREAVIAASVLQKVSVPILHSSAALSWLVQQPFSPAATVFIRVLLEKKYALPYQTVDDCVFYFMKFRNFVDGQQVQGSVQVLPVVWHKAFLAFAQRYKNDITEDQRDFLIETVRQRNHKDISPEIRRELLAGNSREFVTEPTSKDDDLMLDII
ncbi:probable Essential nuclear protein 1 [Saccharomycodes ludwigii]|uniref:Probable Essential nuclear protein 1 n=1 Tax=Saccharomycodes ludwigii TaxID=36035 RepID=A0A376B8U8_9ASCO|nr:hypothetical protein SCDLUD_001044 [Saccharomycodes ludwigii]KAH3903408.1 hypothetical protein SCDLUD_001044 [Saccharomycodes ludwigii]SSD60954.1 probable Essential nuclear protein 1 [Saccharomycodes ludwigii]